MSLHRPAIVAIVCRSRRIAQLAVLPLLVGGCAIAASPGGDTGDATETGSDNAAVDALFAHFDQPGSPGCGLAVAQDGELTYARGYGYANLDHDIRNSPYTVFDVGSVTKQFTAASLTMLALEGKLSLDDDIRRWLPELPAYEPTITIRHLLHHTGGLRDYLNLFPLAGRNDYFPISHAQILAMMSRQRAPIFAAGERYRYSNTGYMLLAQILERAAGESLGEMAQARIFDPLGMTGSHMYEDLREVIPGRGIGYDRDEAGNLHIVHNYNFDVTGDGQLYTTMPDLLRWDDWLHGDEAPPIHAMMLTEGHLENGEPVGYAQGIVLREYRGLRTVGHSGGSWGFVTQLVRFVEPALSIAISCNAGWARPGRLAEQVADHYLADQLGPAEDDDPDRDRDGDDSAVPAPELWTAEHQSALAGEFYSPELDATYRFVSGDGGMALRIEQEDPIEVSLLADDSIEFSFGDEALGGTRDASLSLDRDGAGQVAGFRLSAGSERGLVFERR